MNKKEIYFMMFCIKNGKNSNEPLHTILPLPIQLGYYT
jgi:hypothetical protein